MRKLLKPIKKVLTVVSGITGIGTGLAVGAGTTLTGDIIFDGILLIGCVVIVLVNGKEGVPDWMTDLLEDRREDK